MSGVDNRVVGMQFDNAQFEQKLGDTLKGLDQLNKSLDFTNAQRNLGDLSKAGQTFDMGNIGEKVEGVSTKFLALATVGITALSNITNRAVDAGIRIAKALSVDQINQGFHDYETNINAIQTVLANTAAKGTKLDDVNSALKQLNTYANQTVYNFTDMTKNIGTFTAAGVDLGTSVTSIKGIANIAAMSGSSADQAAGAMYQLSQAIAAGSVKLQDWNSVVNSGMGGAAMQEALFNTGKALGTLKGVPVNESFDQWTKAGNSFRESLQDGWVTSKVLTTALGAMSGDVTQAQLQTQGFSEASAAAMINMGKTAFNAATQIKTFSQLTDVVKESVAAGWSQTFGIIIGNFDQAKTLFSDIGNTVGNVVQKSADARNALLQGWADLGGRTALINGFKNAVKALADIFGAVKSAFREVFPPETSKQLADASKTFELLTAKLIPSESTINKIKLAFDAVFYALDIGKAIVMGVVGVFETLIGNIFGRLGAGGGALDLLAKLGTAMINLDNFLVGEGRISAFFNAVDHDIANFFEWILKAIDVVKRFFNTGDEAGASPTNKTLSQFDQTASRTRTNVELLEQIFQRLGQRFKEVAGIFDTNSAAFKWLATISTAISHALGVAGEEIHKWFSELGQKIADSMKPGDFDAAVDSVNVGLLGGVLVLLHKFMGQLKEFDLSGGIMDSIKETLEGVKGQLKAMQTELKAKALEEIAIALAVLTASIVVLSLIDSDKLTKAMAALAIGMGELVGVMKLMDSIASNTKDATKFTVLAAGMTLLATAALILSGAVALMAQLSWEELAKGLGAVTAMMAIMVVTAKSLEGSSASLIAAGIAMVPLATGIVILAGAIDLFGHMSWETMGKGLLGLAVALGIIAGVMTAMPVISLVAAGVAMIPLATGIVILAGAIKLFATLSWAEMAKGLVAMAGALGIIAVAMNAMPITLPITAAGLVLVGIALTIMAGAIKLFGSMDWGAILKGLTGIAGLMIILAVGVNAMSGALGGAAALLIVSASLTVLVKVLVALSALSWTDLAKGLAAMAAVFIVLGIAGLALEPVIPALIGLGIAMTLVGAGFTLFGAGAYLVGKAIEVLAVAGKAGVSALIDAFNMLIAAIPKLIATLLSSLIKSSGDILNSAQLMLNIMTTVVLQILDTVIKIAPQIGAALVAIITSALILIRAKFPDVALTALDLLLTLLTTIRNNIGLVTQLAVEIVVNLAQTLTANAQKLVDAAVNLVVAFVNALASRAEDITGAGVALILTFLTALVNNVFKITDWAVSAVIAVAQTISNEAGRLVTAGADILINFVQGLADNVYRVANKGVDTVIAFLDAIGKETVRLAAGAAQALVDFLNGLATAIREKDAEIRQAGINVATAMLSGMTAGLTDNLNIGSVVTAAVDVARKAYNAAKDWLLSKSPSKRFMTLGKSMADGIAVALDADTNAADSAVAHAERIVKAFQETLMNIPDSLAGMDEFNPTITPVLDLSKVHAGAKTINDLILGSPITPDVSIDQARLISTTTDLVGKPADPLANQRPTSVTFNQTINSPSPLSTNEIYKQTNSQIAKAKEELSI